MGALPVYHLEAEHVHGWHQGRLADTFKTTNKWHKSIKVRHSHSVLATHVSHILS